MIMKVAIFVISKTQRVAGMINGNRRKMRGITNSRSSKEEMMTPTDRYSSAREECDKHKGDKK